MVKGEIQTIPQCIFDKFSFPTYGLDSKWCRNRKLSIGIFPSVVSLSELSIPLLLIFFMYTSEITLVLFYSFSNHLNIGVQIVRIMSSWGSWFYDSSSIIVGTISGLNKNPLLLLVQSMHLH